MRQMLGEKRTDQGRRQDRLGKETRWMGWPIWGQGEGRRQERGGGGKGHGLGRGSEEHWAEGPGAWGERMAWSQERVYSSGLGLESLSRK